MGWGELKHIFGRRTEVDNFDSVDNLVIDVDMKAVSESLASEKILFFKGIPEEWEPGEILPWVND